jgi:hypothetical protein
MSLWFNFNNNFKEFENSFIECPETIIRKICLLLINENRQTQIEGYKLFGRICLITFINIISKHFDKKGNYHLIDRRYMNNVLLLLYMHYGKFRDLNETSGRLMIQNINEPLNIWKYITKSNLDEYYFNDINEPKKQKVNLNDEQIKELLEEYDNEMFKIILNLPNNTINLIKNTKNDINIDAIEEYKKRLIISDLVEGNSINKVGMGDKYIYYNIKRINDFI